MGSDVMIPNTETAFWAWGATALACFMIGVFFGRIWRNAANPLDVDSRMPPPMQKGLQANIAHKQPEFILAMRAEFFDGCHHFGSDLNSLRYEDFLSWPETSASLVIAQRQYLEKNPNYRQLLPYILLYREDADERRYFLYQRTRKVGEQRLAGALSIGFGGHVELHRDTVMTPDGMVDLRNTLGVNMTEEMNEEVKCLRGEIEPLDLFITHQEGVQRNHLGIVMQTRAIVGAAVQLEPELRPLGFYTPAEIITYATRYDCEIEVWSRLLIDAMLDSQQQRLYPYPRV